MKNITKLILGLTILLITSCNSDKVDNTKQENLPAIRVKAKTVKGNAANLFISTNGKVQAINSADLSTRIMGFIDKVDIKVGDKVQKGQLLIAINNADLQAKKAQVEANILKAKTGLKNAEKDFKRFKNLIAQNSISQKEMDDMTAQYKMAKANLQAVEQMKNEITAQFTYTNIRAPFSGVVTNLYVDKGTMANPGMPLVSVEEDTGFEVITMVPESEISKISKGIAVDVLIKSLQKTVKGKVVEVSSSSKNTGSQYLVKVQLEVTNTPILSGMFATVQFPVKSNDNKLNAVLILKNALVKKGELQGVYTVSKSNTALLRWLRLGRDFGDKVEVLSGLTMGEDYIYFANGKLYNGANIKVEN
ncbi:efflux RND transporter periplasmic adaptor subunit [Polaribacter sp.]|uniref:efflux RND transporter periplasmic adaptor subunit n=1 Tax=Polaribacter sp. TaxID=1920175 RepID=UPI003F6B88CD